MPSVVLHTEASTPYNPYEKGLSGLPMFLQTPSGLAILEIQGTIHAPFPQVEGYSSDHNQSVTQTAIGKLEFPLFDLTGDPNDLKWMKRVYLYVGKHQRLTGEVKKLPKALAVVGKRTEVIDDPQTMTDPDGHPDEELEILEIIKHKIIFGGRPEPVSD